MELLIVYIITLTILTSGAGFVAYQVIKGGKK